jgi:putative methionine-R-sulfoxide reductase with GAF domain
MDLAKLEALMSGYWLSDISNFSAYVADKEPDINWVGVLDIDSPSVGRFKKEDQIVMEKAVAILSKKITENLKARPSEIFGQVSTQKL